MYIKSAFFLLLGIFLCQNAMGQFNTIMGKNTKIGSGITIHPLCETEDYSLKDNNIREKVVSSDNGAGEEADDEVLKETTKSYNESIFNYCQYVSLPLDSVVVTSRFGERVHPIERTKKLHNGIDLRAKGNYVYSVMPGKVKKSGHNRRSGNYVVIEHGIYQSVYCHLSKRYVKRKEKVRAGQIIGLSGNTGLSTGEHLHFSLKQDGDYIDPEPFLDLVKRIFEQANQKLK